VSRGKKGGHGGNMVSPVIENIVKAVQHAAAKLRETAHTASDQPET
jgi:hypothetical protein